MKLDLTKAGRFLCLTLALFFVSGQDAFTREPADHSRARIATCPPIPGGDPFTVPSDAPDASQLRDQLGAATSDLRNAVKSQDPQQKASVPELAGLRKGHLIHLLRTDPAAVSSELLTRSERRAVDKSTNGCVELESEVEGTAEVLIEDNFDEGTSRTFYFVVTDREERLNLYPLAALKTHVQTGQRVRVKGLRLDDNIILDRRSEVSAISSDDGVVEAAAKPPPEPPSTVYRRTLAVLVYFQDTPEPSIPSASASQALDWARDYYLEVSYEQLGLSGIINPDSGADVFGWYPVPLNQSCGSRNEVRDAALSAVVAAEGIDPSIYDGHVIIAPFGPNCTWQGLAQVPGVTSWVRPTSSAIPASTTAHEIGHNLGNDHASFLLPCGGFPVKGQGCEIDEYGDPYDIMGGNGHFNAPHKEFVGFLDETQVLDVKASGTYSIEPIETDTGGVKALKLQRAEDDYLYIEFRQDIGLDANFPIHVNVYDGALLHIMAAPHKTLLIDPLDAGINDSALEKNETFVDPVSGHSVTVTRISRKSLKVDIQYATGEFNPPTADITSPMPGAQLSGIVSVSATVTDDTGISQVDFYYDGEGLIELFDPITSESPDDIYTSMLDTNILPDGLYDLYVVATDVYGNSTESSRVAVSVVNASAPVVTITSPADGSSFRSGRSITFAGTATDPVEGDLTANLAWDSDADGSLGTGASVVTSALSTGVHQITASVINSGWVPGADTITVTVTACAGRKCGK